MSEQRPDESPLWALLEEINAGHVKFYCNVLSQPCVNCQHAAFASLDVPIRDRDFRGWICNFVWEKDHVLLREREIDRILELLVGRSLGNHVSSVSDPAVLKAIDQEPVVATILEFMHGNPRPATRS